MTPVTPPSTVVELAGLRINYLDWGRRDAEPIVCVHGYTSSAQAFNAPARHLQDRFRLIVPDVRGHGDSAWSPAGAYEYADQVADLAALVDRLRLDRLPCPTLVVWGTDSDVLSEAQARRMVDTLPKGQLVAVPGVGHAPTLVEPVVLAALERFLAS
jgi:pimeloyl-ACP methyl ester carboxylesterase